MNMIRASIKLVTLAHKYGLPKAAYICTRLLLKQDFWISVQGVPFWMNAERDAVYHLLHSIEKLEAMVEAIPGSVSGHILDVGANCGLFSLLARLRFPDAEIHAFEPASRIQPILERNLRPKHIHIIRAAVSDTDGSTVLFVNPKSQQTNSILRSSVEAFADTIEVERVPTIRLDTFLDQQDIAAIDLIKIDVQGAEKRILEGGRRALHATRYLIAEVSFLDPAVFQMIDDIRRHFPFHRVLGPVLSGADILFSRDPLP